jgi:hypothetical protein
MSTSGYQLIKVADEGTSSPFYGRIYLGTLVYRDWLYTNKDDQKKFDHAFYPVFKSLEAVRKSAKLMCALITEFESKFYSGEIIVEGRVPHLTESIDEDLNQHFSTFLNRGHIAFDQLQKLLNVLDLKISFFYGEDKKFATEIQKLKDIGEVSLTEYLEKTRQAWSKDFKDLRRAAEHFGWVLPQAIYDLNNKPPKFQEPMVNGVPLKTYVRKMFNRLCVFIEDLIAYGLAKKLIEKNVCLEEELIFNKDIYRTYRFKKNLNFPQFNPRPWEIYFVECSDFIDF